MKNSIAVCNVHLGDNPNYFPDSNYIGYALQIPVWITEVNPTADTIYLIIKTSVIETLKGEGHYVMINDAVVGRLKDEDNDETERIAIQKNYFLQLIGKEMFFILTIKIDTWENGQGSSLLDDFQIKLIEIENAKPRAEMKIPK